MASIKVSDLQVTTSTAADSFLYVADTTNGGVGFDSKKITVANFLNAYATEAFVSTQISDLINGAPEALNTLKEISDVIGDSNDVVGNLISMIDANETHVDNVATLTGVSKDSADMGSFSGSTIADSSTIKAALQALETSLETKGAASDLSGVISNTGDLVTLSGVAAGSVNLGVFDGNTLSDNATLKVVLQDAEDAIEANASAISSEASARAAAITALTNGAVADNTSAINQEVTDRAAAITALTNGAVADNAAGIVTNAAAITSLTNGAVATNAAAIAQEVTDRQAAVSAEATARADADALLMPKAGGTFTGAISGPAPTADGHLATKKYADDLVANVDLSQVETNRVNIAAETSARTSADTALSGRLDVLEADPTTGTALQAEASTRASADTALSNRVTSLEADPTTQTLLNAETTARTSADTALSNRLDTLEADPTTQTLLDAETAARIAGDALLLPLAGGTMSGDIEIGSVSSAVAGIGATTLIQADNASDIDATSGTAIGLTTTNTGDWYDYLADTILPAGQSYAEITVGDDFLRLMAGTTDGGDTRFDWMSANTSLTGIDIFSHNGTEYYKVYVENTLVHEVNPSPQVVAGDVFGFLMDKDNGTLSFYKNGTLIYTATSGVSGANERFGFTHTSTAVTANFGATAFAHNPGGSGGGAASTIGVDGSASFGGNVIASAVPSDDAHLVNKLYADNLVAGVDLSGIATNAAAIEALTNGAPELLNTLAELGDAIGDDANFATTITNQITNESTTRASADTALSGRLDVLEADPTTATALASEASTRATADTALSNRLDTLEADPTTQTLLNAETSARTSADSALSGRLDTLEADPTTQTLLTAEATTRAAADTALSGRLDTLEADPTTATSVTNAIAVETAARIAGDALKLDLAGGTMTGAIELGSGAASGGVWDSSYLKGAPTFSNNDQTFTASAIQEGALASFTIPLTGKYYWEIELSGDLDTGAGYFPDGESLVNSRYVGQQPGFYGFRAGQSGSGSAQIYTNSSYAGVDSGNVLNRSASTTIGFTVDRDTGKAEFYRGGDKNERYTILPATHELFGVILGNNAPAGSSVTLVTSASDWTYPAPAGFEALPETPGSGGATTIGVDGTATFGSTVSASAVPTADAHLVNKLYADQLVANVDLSQVETNRLAIIQEISDRAAAITALTNGQVATNATNISANATAISQEVTDRAAAITSLTNGQVATNTSGIATNATAITNLTNGAVADNAAAITALTNGTVADNTAAITQEVTDRQAAIAALTNGAVADNAAAITALTNGAVADNAAAVVQEAADRAAADALKVDKQSLVNEHLLGQTSAQSAPVDAQGNSNYLFLVVDKATGALKSIDKTFLEAE